MPEHACSDGVRLAVDIAGPDDAPTAVLVHGLAASVALGWDAAAVRERLGAGGLRTVAYDGRGHGRSDAPHDAARYGDARLVDDLAEIVDTYGGPAPVVAGYSMGAAIVLLALSGGLPARAAVVGAAPRAVLEWTDADAAQVDAAVTALEGSGGDPVMHAWLAFLDATGCDRRAMAALLRGHRPVVDHWDRIRVPVVVAAGSDDLTAAPPGAVAALLGQGRALSLVGDHIGAVADPAFTDAIVDAARV